MNPLFRKLHRYAEELKQEEEGFGHGNTTNEGADCAPEAPVVDSDPPDVADIPPVENVEEDEGKNASELDAIKTHLEAMKEHIMGVEEKMASFFRSKGE